MSVGSSLSRCNLTVLVESWFKLGNENQPPGKRINDLLENRYIREFRETATVSICNPGWRLFIAGPFKMSHLYQRGKVWHASTVLLWM